MAIPSAARPAAPMRGFSLVETLLAASMLALGIAVNMQLQHLSQQNLTHIHMQNQAADLADSVADGIAAGMTRSMLQQHFDAAAAQLPAGKLVWLNPSQSPLPGQTPAVQQLAVQWQWADVEQQWLFAAQP